MRDFIHFIGTRGRLKHIVTTWIQTHKSVSIYGGGGIHITQLKLYRPQWLVTAWTSRPNVSRRCFERLVLVSSRTGGTDVSVSSGDHHSNVSVSSRSRHHTSRLQPCVEVTLIAASRAHCRPTVISGGLKQSKYVAVHHKISRNSPGDAWYKLTRISNKHYQSSYSVIISVIFLKRIDYRLNFQTHIYLMELLTTRHLPLFKFLSLSSILPHVTDMVLEGHI